MNYQRKILPPIWLILFLLLAYALDRWLPLWPLPGVLAQVGQGLAVLGLLLIFWALASFARAHTGVVPFSEATKLITGGLFRVTRNPMYLGMALILMGAALQMGSVGSLLCVPFFPLVIQNRFIIPEERFLHDTFGESYKTYLGRVRRWL